MSLDEYEEHDGTTEQHERRITRCRSCNKQIVFLKTRNGKAMPVDADTVEPSDQEFDQQRHKSHFASCPKADKHRRRR